MEEVRFMSVIGIAEIVIESTMADIRTMVASTNGTIPQRTGLFDIRRTIFRALFARERALFKVGTDHRGIKTITRF